MRNHDSHHEDRMGGGYGKLATALLLSFLVMYPLTMEFVVR